MMRQSMLKFSRSGLTGVASKRCFAAAAANDVVLPISLYGLSARYANALFKTAARAGTLDGVEQELSGFSELIQSSPALKTYLNDPVISRKDKAADIEKICVGMSDISRGFFGVLADNGRLKEVEKIIGSFDQLMKAQRGEVEATVTTAETLTKKQLKAVTKSITSNYLESGKTLQLTQKIDPEILGGLQVQVGDRFLDLSISSQIKKVHTALSAN